MPRDPKLFLFFVLTLIVPFSNIFQFLLIISTGIGKIQVHPSNFHFIQLIFSPIIDRFGSIYREIFGHFYSSLPISRPSNWFEHKGSYISVDTSRYFVGIPPQILREIVLALNSFIYILLPICLSFLFRLIFLSFFLGDLFE